MMSYQFTAAEEEAMHAFLSQPKISRAISNGARWAVVFGPNTGIGIPVEITVQEADGTIHRKDVTDLSAW